MLGQVIKVIRLVGLRRAAGMKRRHEAGLRYVRGYAATCGWRTLLNNGFLDDSEREGGLEWQAWAAERGMDAEVMGAVVEYLVGIGLLEEVGRGVRMSKAGRDLFLEPRGLFELLWAYEPCLGNLAELMTGEKRYGREVTRDVTYVGIGSGRLCEQLPYPVMRRMVREQGGRMVLDLGCGDMALLRGLCEQDEGIRGHGIDCAAEMAEFCRGRLAEEDYGGRLTVGQGDMFEIGGPLGTAGEVDCITACDTFHEYLQEPERLVELLRRLREVFAGAAFVIGEFCLQDAEWLRRHPTASLEHHLFHQLSNQQIGTAGQWREIFGQAGLEIVEEEVYDLIGHGYFTLR